MNIVPGDWSHSPDHQERVAQERRKMELAFAARGRALERIGLPQVRNHRRMQLEREQADWRADLARRGQAMPELNPLLFIAVIAAEGAP